MSDDDASVISLFQNVRGAELNTQVAALAPVGEDGDVTAWCSTSPSGVV